MQIIILTYYADKTSCSMIHNVANKAVQFWVRPSWSKIIIAKHCYASLKLPKC